MKNLCISLICPALISAGLTVNCNAQNFVWARQMGGTSGDYGASIAVDGSGNVYTTGYFQDTADFDPGAGTFNLTAAGNSDIFVSKLDAAGNFVWAKQLGGTSYDIGTSIAVDGSGNVCTTGSFEGTADFDPGAGTFNLTSAGAKDIFVSKLNASGNFVWARQFGGTSYDIGASIAIGGSGNVYTTGLFYGIVDFDPGAGTFNLTSGSNDIFVSKLDATGTFVWAKQLGGINGDRGYSVAVDGSGNVYTTGYFQDTADFDPGAGTFNLASAGFEDIFVSKLNASGSFVWAKQLGGINDDWGYSVAVDGSGNVYTTGHFQDTADFDPGAGTFNLASVGFADIFISKLDNASGIEENSEVNSIKIFPNPTGGKFQITSYELRITSVEIYNVLGEKMYSSIINNQSAIINFDAPGGIYFMHLRTEQGIINKKLIFR